MSCLPLKPQIQPLFQINLSESRGGASESEHSWSHPTLHQTLQVQYQNNQAQPKAQAWLNLPAMKVLNPENPILAPT